MSSPTNDSKNRDGHLDYAPKWARERDRVKSPSIADGEFEETNEQSIAKEDRFVDQTGADHSLKNLLNQAQLHDAQFARSTRQPNAEEALRDDADQPLSDRDLSRLRRSLEPHFVEEPWPAMRPKWRLAARVALTVAIALMGAGLLLFVIDKVPLPSADSTSKFSDNTRQVEQAAAPSAPSPIASTVSQTNDIGSQRAASVGKTSDASQTVHGVSDSEIHFGIAAPFTGPARELGRQMKLGIETAFNLANDAGGIDGRQLRLAVADDGYEPTRTAVAMNQLYDKQQVFGFIGNVGTPTAAVALPYALEHKSLFFGAFTGADLLRRDPPDRYVFNYRASYAEETNAVVRYLVNVRRLRPEQIAVFAQHDAYGDAGFAGVAKAIRALNGDDTSILRLDYERNTVDVDDAVARLHARRTLIKAVVMVATYRAAAQFIGKTRDAYPSMIYTNVSFVGSTALADELMLLGPRYANGVVVTQVVPAVQSYASVILKYRNALSKYFPGEAPDYVSLEGYVDGAILLEALKRAGPQIDTEKLVDSLENLRGFDMGLGTLISFSPSEHQGSHKVWGTQLDDHGRYQPIDLE